MQAERAGPAPAITPGLHEEVVQKDFCMQHSWDSYETLGLFL